MSKKINTNNPNKQEMFEYIKINLPLYLEHAKENHSQPFHINDVYNHGYKWNLGICYFPSAQTDDEEFYSIKLVREELVFKNSTIENTTHRYQLISVEPTINLQRESVLRVGRIDQWSLTFDHPILIFPLTIDKWKLSIVKC